MNSSQKGTISELKVATKMSELGYDVSFPFDGSCRYDLIVDYDNYLSKVQVKYGHIDNNCVVAGIRSHNPNMTNDRVKYYTHDEIDEFIIYCDDNEEIYSIPIEDAPKTKITLRLNGELSKYASENNINWAEEYRISKAL